MRNRTHIIHIALFIGFLLLGGGLCVLHGQRDFSEMENRVLIAFPKVTFDGIVNGSVQKDFDRATGDQILGRDAFVKLTTGLRFLMGERQLGDVYVGEDGRYLEKVTDADISEKRLATNLSVIKKLASDHPDIRTTVFLAPTNSVVASYDLPAGAYLYDDAAVCDSIRSALPDTEVIYEPEAFSADDYFATDHHWNTYGAQKGAGLYLKSVDKENDAALEFSYEKAGEPFFGTLYSKAPLAICNGEEFLYPAEIAGITVSINGKQTGGIYDPSYLEKKDKYAAYFGGNFGRVEIVNENAASDDTLLMVKDSFANSAIPYLTGEYKRIIMIDLRYHNASFLKLVDEEKPDEFLFFYEMSDFFEDENFSKLLK